MRLDEIEWLTLSDLSESEFLSVADEIALDVLPPLHPIPPANAEVDLTGKCCPRCKSAEGVRKLTFMWLNERLDWAGNPLGRDVGPSTSVSECVQCGFQVAVLDDSELRVLHVCRAIHAETGIHREFNESVEAYQSRLIDKYGNEWPAMLQRIVTRVMSSGN